MKLQQSAEFTNELWTHIRSKIKFKQARTQLKLRQSVGRTNNLGTHIRSKVKFKQARTHMKPRQPPGRTNILSNLKRSRPKFKQARMQMKLRQSAERRRKEFQDSNDGLAPKKQDNINYHINTFRSSRTYKDTDCKFIIQYPNRFHLCGGVCY